MGVRNEIYYYGQRKGCRGEFLPGRKGMRSRGLQGWWVFAYSSGLQFQLIDKRNSGIPSDGNHLRFQQPQGATGGPPRRGHGPRCSLHTEIFPSRRLGTPRQPAPPEAGLRAPTPSAAPAPTWTTAERPEKSGLGPEAGRVGGSGRSPRHSPRDSDLRVGPRFHRRRPSVTSAPAAAAAAAGSQSQTLASLRSRRRRRRQRSRTPTAAASSARPRARSQFQILLLAPGNCQVQLPQQPRQCSSQPPLANRRRRRRRQGSDCLRQPWTRPAPPRPAAPPSRSKPRPRPAARPFFGRRLRPSSPPPPRRPVAARAWACAAAWDPLLALRGDLSRGGEGGGGCVLTSPSSRESLPPPTPSPLGPEPFFVFQAGGTRWLLGRYPLLGGTVELGELPLATPLTLLLQKATPQSSGSPFSL
ncbi:uncharacterized protein LOC141574980 [Camelus bactrianus]|uniref:Uncharacterized protein LOC141574980 n=1 Tax=Camelus bactrianus TaxID=9837 RepID=A0AC58PFH1_CAMBA